MFVRLCAELVSLQVTLSSLDCQVGAASREHPQVGILSLALSARCISEQTIIGGTVSNAFDPTTSGDVWEMGRSGHTEVDEPWRRYCNCKNRPALVERV